MKPLNEKDAKSGPLERYIQILEAISSAPHGLSGKELEMMLRLPKTTVTRLLSGLVASDLVQSSGRGRNYLIGARLQRILQSDTAWIEIASERPLKNLAEATGETCFIARLFGATVQSVIMESPDASVGVYVMPGHVMAPHATASGKVLTAYQDPALRDAILQSELQRLTDRTVLERSALEGEFVAIRGQGYAIENGEHIQGLATIACPIILFSNLPPIYAIGLTGPAARVSERAVPEFLPRLKATASELARAFRPGQRNLAR